MQAEVGRLVIDFLESNNLLETVKAGAKGIDFQNLVCSFSKEYPSEDTFEVRYAMEYLAGRSDVLHSQRTAALNRASKEFSCNRHRELRKMRAIAVEIEGIIKETKKDLCTRYLAAATKEKNAVSQSEKIEAHTEKGFVREDLDMLRELSKAGVTSDPLVISAINRMEKEECKSGDKGLEGLKSFLEELNNIGAVQ